MDHSYRAALAGGNNSNGSRPGRQRPGFAPYYPQAEPEPLPAREDAAPRIFGFVDDLFFQAKIQETARKLNVKVELLKAEQDLTDRIKTNGDERAIPAPLVWIQARCGPRPVAEVVAVQNRQRSLAKRFRRQ